MANNTGVYVSDASGNTVGGTAGAARNLISGNDVGVHIDRIGGVGNTVEGDYIGTNSSGAGA